MISPALIDRLTRLQGQFYPDTCTVQRYAETNTPDGVEHGWADHLVGVPCRVEVQGSTAVERAGQAEAAMRALSEWQLWLPASTDVTANDRLRLDPPDGRTFEIRRVDQKSYETTRAVLCSLVA